MVNALQNLRLDTLARGLACVEFRTDVESVALRAEFLAAMTDVRLDCVSRYDEALLRIAECLVWP